MGQNWGWVEIPIFATIALGFGIWQLVSINREIARDRAAKAAQATTDPASASGAGHAEGQQGLDNR